MYWDSIISDIEGATYERLLDYIFETCDVLKVEFLKYRGKNEEKQKEIMSSMIEFERRFSNFFYNNITRKTENSIWKLYYVTLNDSVKEYLLSNKNLFSWVYPSDFTFFRNDYCFFDSDYSEKECWICCDTLEEFDTLKKIGITFENSIEMVDKESKHINKLINHLDFGETTIHFD